MQSRVVERCAVVLAVVIVATAGPAVGQDVERGKRLAAAWCTSCHQVEPQQGTSDLAPSFEIIANTRDKPESDLRAWLISPHPPMPDFNLSEDEIDDLLGYIGTLRSE